MLKTRLLHPELLDALTSLGHGSRVRAMLGTEVVIDLVDRAAFYEHVRAADTGLIVATGERRTYANVLLTIGIA